MTVTAAQQSIDERSFLPERSVGYVRRWAGDDEPASAPHPAPVVPMRDAKAAEIPGTARRLAVLAVVNDWTVRATYCRGTYATNVSSRVVDSLALRLRRDESRAFGIWHDGRFTTACAWSADAWPVVVNATQLRALVEAAP